MSITIDKSGSNTAAITSIQADRGRPIELRQSKYLNNLGEQDHRAVKRITRPMLGFKTFGCARILLAEVVQVLRLAHLDGQAAVGLHARDRRCVRAALVDGDLLGHTVQVHGALEECPSCGVISLGAQKEVDGVAVAVLEDLFPLTGRSGFVFPAEGRPGRTMSDGTVNAALRVLGYPSDVMTGG